MRPVRKGGPSSPGKSNEGGGDSLVKAVTFAEFGGPEKLKVLDRPDPSLGDGEVLVAVAASAVNPTDVANLAGARAPLMKDIPAPYTAGMDFSGHVVSVGPGVDSVAPGQPVIGVVSPRRPSGGAHAELLAVPARSVAPVSDGTNLIAAATVPMNALTGMLCLELLGLAEGQTILITGAAGMLGSLSVELSKLAGLNVLANGSESDRDFLIGLGLSPESVLPRGDSLEGAVRRACPGGVDGVIDGALIGQSLVHLVRDGGGIVSVRRAYEIVDPRLNISYVQVTTAVEDQAKIARIGHLLDDGKLTPRVARNGVFDLAGAADAYSMASASGLRGRVVIAFGG